MAVAKPKTVFFDEKGAKMRCLGFVGVVLGRRYGLNNEDGEEQSINCHLRNNNIKGED